MFKGIELNGSRYLENSKCPACSSERDKGGRLKLHKLARHFLKCELCKYSILSKETRDRQENRQRAHQAKSIKFISNH